MREKSEEIWGEFLSKGDESSFAELYDYYSDKLFSYGISLGFEREICKDAVQDVFIRVHSHKSKIKETNNPASFLFRTYRNRLIDIVRSNKNELDIDSISSSFTLNVTILDSIIDRERAKKLKSTVETLLNKLSPTQREAIYMRYIAEMEYSEISDMLNIKPESARKLMHRAMEKLREHNLDEFSKTAFIVALFFTHS